MLDQVNVSRSVVFRFGVPEGGSTGGGSTERRLSRVRGAVSRRAARRKRGPVGRGLERLGCRDEPPRGIDSRAGVGRCERHGRAIRGFRGGFIERGRTVRPVTARPVGARPVTARPVTVRPVGVWGVGVWGVGVRGGRASRASFGEPTPAGAVSLRRRDGPNLVRPSGHLPKRFQAADRVFRGGAGVGKDADPIAEGRHPVVSLQFLEELFDRRDLFRGPANPEPSGDRISVDRRAFAPLFGDTEELVDREQGLGRFEPLQVDDLERFAATFERRDRVADQRLVFGAGGGDDRIRLRFHRDPRVGQSGEHRLQHVEHGLNVGGLNRVGDQLRFGCLRGRLVGARQWHIGLFDHLFEQGDLGRQPGREDPIAVDRDGNSDVVVRVRAGFETEQRPGDFEQFLCGAVLQIDRDNPGDGPRGRFEDLLDRPQLSDRLGHFHATGAIEHDQVTPRPDHLGELFAGVRGIDPAEGEDARHDVALAPPVEFARRDQLRRFPNQLARVFRLQIDDP